MEDIYMNKLQGTKTAENLSAAFAGESQARMRYTYYELLAEKDNHKHIASIFRETAENERAHARVFFNHLVKGLGKSHIKVNAEYPIAFGTTEDNLLAAAEGEKEEWGNLYPNFAKIAKEEGFPEVEDSFTEILSIEKGHEKRYLDLLDALKNGTLYKKQEPQYWKCRNCGYIHMGLESPAVCPACKHPQGFFEVMFNFPIK
jgi:rubrerythrin